MKLAVVIPAYNAQAFIAETIDSVLQQSFPLQQVEIVVVDDGSTDATNGVVEAKLKGQGNVKILSRRNGGPSCARNAGWRATEAEWIQFLDADDLLTPSKLQRQATLATNVAPEVAVIYSPWSVLEEQGGAWRHGSCTRRPEIGGDPVLDLLQTENFIATGSQLFRRAWLQRTEGFNENYRFIEDVDLALRIAIAGGKYVYADSETPLFFYRHRLGSLSRSDRLAFTEGCVRNAKLAEEHWRGERDGLTPSRREALLGIYSSALRAFYEHDRARFRDLLPHVLRLDSAYCPTSPLLLRYLSRLLGYSRAEAVALAYRRIKRILAF